MRSIKTEPNSKDWHKTHVSPFKNTCNVVTCKKCKMPGCLKWHKIGDKKKHLVVHHSHFLDENKFPQARNYHHKILEAEEK